MEILNLIDAIATALSTNPNVTIAEVANLVEKVTQLLESLAKHTSATPAPVVSTTQTPVA